MLEAVRSMVAARHGKNGGAAVPAPGAQGGSCIRFDSSETALPAADQARYSPAARESGGAGESVSAGESGTWLPCIRSDRSDIRRRPFSRAAVALQVREGDPAAPKPRLLDRVRQPSVPDERRRHHHAPPRGQPRHPDGTGAAGPQGRQHDDDLHARAQPRSGRRPKHRGPDLRGMTTVGHRCSGTMAGQTRWFRIAKDMTDVICGATRQHRWPASTRGARSCGRTGQQSAPRRRCWAGPSTLRWTDRDSFADRSET